MFRIYKKQSHTIDTLFSVARTTYIPNKLCASVCIHNLAYEEAEPSSPPLPAKLTEDDRAGLCPTCTFWWPEPASTESRVDALSIRRAFYTIIKQRHSRTDFRASLLAHTQNTHTNFADLPPSFSYFARSQRYTIEQLLSCFTYFPVAAL